MTQSLNSLNRNLAALLKDTHRQRESITRLTVKVDRLCAAQAASDSTSTDLQAMGEQAVEAAEQTLRVAEAQRETSKRQLSTAQRQSQAIAQMITVAKQHCSGIVGTPYRNEKPLSP
jgi:cell division septum initiation protein DivIVA